MKTSLDERGLKDSRTGLVQVKNQHSGAEPLTCNLVNYCGGQLPWE